MLQLKSTPRVYYYNSNASMSSTELSRQLTALMEKVDLQDRQIVLLCIGSDRSTGDSLGPLIGYKLEKLRLPGVLVYGTLNQPVHAANLEEKLNEITSEVKNPYIIAIDASLGLKEHIGFVTLGTGPLKPGLGVNKELPHVGDLHITGIVNVSGMMETLLLQTTRLSTVMKLADSISRGIIHSLMPSRIIPLYPDIE